MAVQNMYLMCSASNIGCYWSSARITEHIKEAFTLQENQKCLGLFYMGNLEN
jgi:nitroreductase